MKTIGLIGGLSWQSTVLYYQWLNQGVATREGGLASAKLVMVSVNFAEIATMQHNNQWHLAAEVLADAAKQLAKAGADIVLICSNTMHKLADDVAKAVSIPLLHLADATAAVIKQNQLKRVGLLATQFTMEQGFYKDRLTQQGLDVLVPNADQRQIVHRIIYDELCQGTVTTESKIEYQRIIEDLLVAGAEGIILGCTEITLLIKPSDITVMTFDTTAIHVEAALDFALG